MTIGVWVLFLPRIVIQFNEPFGANICFTARYRYITVIYLGTLSKEDWVSFTCTENRIHVHPLNESSYFLHPLQRTGDVERQRNYIRTDLRHFIETRKGLFSFLINIHLFETNGDFCGRIWLTFCRRNCSNMFRRVRLLPKNSRALWV